MAEPFVKPTTPSLNCVFTNCDKLTSTCEYTCAFSDPFLSPPPPPPPSPQPPLTSSNAGPTHVAPFLIATVCILGISFLLLTTCTIILRHRFRNRRRNSSVRHDQTLIDDGGDHGVVVDHPVWYIRTVGLQQSVIDSITAFRYDKSEGLLTEGSDCSVCLTEFDDGDDLRLLPKCSHAFHVSCIDVWLRSHKNCPVCRAPVVNEGGVVLDLGSGEGVGDLEEGDVGFVSVDVEGGEGSRGLEETRDEFVELPIEDGVKIAEILRKNRELRVFSDLGENYRFRRAEHGVEPVRRSFSFSSSAAFAIYREMSHVSVIRNEGCSGNGGLVLQQKKMSIGKPSNKPGSSISGLLMKSSSVGPSLQKGPVSMKRSRSSSGKLFSFRRSKSQASILPL